MKPATYIELYLLMDAHWEEFDGLQRTEWFLHSWLPGSLHIYQQFEHYARLVKFDKNRDKYSARCIIQQMRWESMMADNSDEFKIVNDCTPYMARLVMLRDRRFTDFFRTKRNA